MVDPRVRGHRQRRPAGAPGRGRRGPGGRARRAAGGAVRAGPGGDLPVARAEVERRDARDRRRPVATSATTAPSTHRRRCAPRRTRAPRTLGRGVGYDVSARRAHHADDQAAPPGGARGPCASTSRTRPRASCATGSSGSARPAGSDGSTRLPPARSGPRPRPTSAVAPAGRPTRWRRCWSAAARSQSRTSRRSAKLTRILVAHADVIASDRPTACRSARSPGPSGPSDLRHGGTIPLPDASVDAVFVAGGVNWFDLGRAPAEIARAAAARGPPRGALQPTSTAPRPTG